MKLALLVLIGAFFIYHPLFGQDTLPNLNVSLIASRNGNLTSYEGGARLMIKHKSGSSTERVRGTFAGAFNKSIAIAKKQGGIRSITSIAIEDILMVRKINPRKRLAFGIIGTMLVGGGAAILESTGDSPGKAMGGALVIPVIGVGSYVLFAVPVTLLIEKLNEKKAESGWKFELAK